MFFWCRVIWVLDRFWLLSSYQIFYLQLCSPVGFLWYHDVYFSLLSILSLFWCMVWVGGLVSFFFFCMYQSSSPNTIYWRGYLYSIVCSCPHCQILIGHRDLGLFLGSLFYPLHLCVCSYASTRLFDYSDLVIQFDIRYCDPSCFVLSQNCCSYSGSFMVPFKFLKCFFLYLWNMSWVF